MVEHHARQAYLLVAALQRGGAVAKGPSNAKGERAALIPRTCDELRQLLAAQLAAALVQEHDPLACCDAFDHLSALGGGGVEAWGGKG